LALALRRAQESGEDIGAAVDAAATSLVETRPTARNLRWGIEQAHAALRDGPKSLVARAVDVLEADVATNRALSQRGADLLHEREAELGRSLHVLTHCNTGALACVEWGTALGIIRAAHERGGVAGVLVTETRPLLQGAHLTTWELNRLGVPYRVVVDSAAPALIQRGRVDAVVVGADRIAANGDVANKIGTFSLALAARHAAIPLIVAAPESTLDPATATGADIPIEERSEDEVLAVNGHRVAPAGAHGLNPAFDVTPAVLVTAIVTERRIIRPALDERVAG